MFRKVAHYAVLEKLGEGAMGVVLKGVDPKLQMQVAIKILSPSVANDKENRVRFEREARAAANLKHPNIAHVFYIGHTEEDLPFYAMEFIDGLALSDVISGRITMTGQQILSIMLQSMRALRFASDNKVLHRDVKPGNIMIDHKGIVKLVDFGLAKISQSDSTLTSTGMAVGTPNYLSPEIAKGEEADFRSDMYSAGVSFFELLTGNLPFKAENPMGVLMKHVQAPIPDLISINSQYPRNLTTIIERMMAKTANRRYDDYEKIIEGLDTVMNYEDRFVEGEWIYCTSCKCNVRSLKENRDQRCTICNQPLELKEKEEILCNVRLLSFESKDSEKQVVEYMQRTTRKSQEAIRQMLSHLPLLLARRLDMEKAKKLQTKFYAMGAQIELEKVSAIVIKPDKPRLTLKSNMSGQMDKTGVAQRNHTPPPQDSSKITMPKLWLIALLLITATGSFFSKALVEQVPTLPPGVTYMERVEDEGDGEPTGQTREKQGTRTIKNAASASYTSPRGYFKLRAVKCGSQETLEGLGRQLEINLSRIGMFLGSSSNARFEVRLDGNKEFADMLPTFGLATSLSKLRIVINCKHLSFDNPELSAILIVQTARQMLREYGGERLPYWFEAGVSLHILNQLSSDSYDPKMQLNLGGQYLDDESWRDMFSTHSPGAYAQAASFVGYLADNYQVDSLVRVAKQAGGGKVFDEAMRNVFHLDRLILMDNWYAQVH